MMIYTALTKRALHICFQAHKRQRDKGGMPYVFHPFHLAEQMDTEEEICTALLHDVVEDTDWTLEDLAEEGFPAAVTQALALMTHNVDTPYLDYVRRLKDNPIAAKVKLADLRHNSTPGRLPDRTEKDGGACGSAAQGNAGGNRPKQYAKMREKDYLRLQKYLRAQAILTGGQADLEKMCLYIEKDGCLTAYSPDGRICDVPDRICDVSSEQPPVL